MPISSSRQKRDPRPKIFPNVPERFWRQFDAIWGDPLEAMADTISLAESLGASPDAEHFRGMEPAVANTLRNLHSRVCRQARAVNTLAFVGLSEQAIVQWRTCHELATVAMFIAEHPKTAPLYIKSAYYEKYNLAKSIPEGHSEAPSKSERGELQQIAAEYEAEVRRTYKFKARRKVTGYNWSGHDNFADIEALVFSDFEWRPRPDFRLASQQTHASSNAGHPVPDNRGGEVLLTGPSQGGLTDAVDKTLLSVMNATAALVLLHAGTCSADDLAKLRSLHEQQQVIGAICWLIDPAILCHECEGYRPGAKPPECLPQETIPHPCRCPDRDTVPDIPQTTVL